MKTIYTSLPIYDRLAKQCFERGKKGGMDKPVPIICPRHRLPSFQWNAESDNMGTVSKIELIDMAGNNANNYNYFKTWVDGSTVSFASLGLDITQMVTNNVNHYAKLTRDFDAVAGDIITITGTFAAASGVGVDLALYNGGYLCGSAGACATLVAGTNTYTLLVPATAVTEVRIGLVDVPGSADFSFTNVRISITRFEDYFPTLPAAVAIGTDTYYHYDGDTLNYLLPEGTYYLKITTSNGYVLYSDWFKVDCVYENLITAWTNTGYETFQVNDTFPTAVDEAGDTAGTDRIDSDTFDIIKNEDILVRFFHVQTSGNAPALTLWVDSVSVDSNAVTAGLNEITLTSTATGTASVRLTNTANSNWTTTEILVNREYSKKYLTINFYNECDLYDIYYSGGFDQTVWFESETMENTYPQDEQGSNDGEGRFIRYFARQVKKYLARTKEMPDFMVDVFNRMKLHDEIELIDLVGNTNDVYNLEVEHEWLWDDKYYAKIDLTFDYNEAYVIGGCCNNLI